MDPRYLDGRTVRAEILDEVRARISKVKAPVGKLVSISIGNVDEISVYIRGQARAAEQVGIPFVEEYWPDDLTQDDCKQRLLAMNDDKNIIGVILQRPVPKHINVRSLQSAIHPLKDVEGMNPGINW